MEVSVYTLDQLSARSTSLFDSFHETGGIQPLTPLRLSSFLSNPRARGSDPVLFLLNDGGKLVAYRTLLPDWYYDRNGEVRSFAWLSGNYVDPGFRRRGLSTRLLRHAEDSWSGRLLYTNYAPASKAVYDRTDRFPLWLERPGARLYLRSSAGDLLSGRIGSRTLLETGDRMINRLRESWIHRVMPPATDRESITVETVTPGWGQPKTSLETELGPELVRLARQIQSHALFGRDIRVFQWILTHPWVTDHPEAPEVRYPFSYRADRFENLLLKFHHADRGYHGMLWLLIHNRRCTVPYLFHSDPSLLGSMARSLVREMVLRQCGYLTLRHPGLLAHLARYRKLFLLSRSMPQLIFAHRDLAASLPEGKQVHDGDGDVVFTG